MATRWARELPVGDVPWGIAPREVVGLFLRQVQALPYAPDDAGPVDLVTVNLRTVLTQGGDCEERAMLLAALLEAAGVRARLVWITQRGAPLDHLTVEAHVEGRWQWADPTVPGARVGEAPEEAARRLVASGAHALGVYEG